MTEPAKPPEFPTLSASTAAKTIAAARRTAQALQDIAEALEYTAAELSGAADHLEAATEEPATNARLADNRINAARDRLNRKVLARYPLLNNYPPLRDAKQSADNLQAAAKAHRARNEPPIEDQLEQSA